MLNSITPITSYESTAPSGQHTQSEPFIETRLCPRVSLAVKLQLRRRGTYQLFLRLVETANVSRWGAAVKSTSPLPIGTEYDVRAFNGKFSGRVRVCHVQNRPEQCGGGYLIGLDLIEKRGQWLIN